MSEIGLVTDSILENKSSGEVPQLKQEYFKNYRSYNIYYKAQVIQNTNLGLILLRSYETDIAIYNPLNKTLFYNLNWYNSSVTTKNQLNHFLEYYVYSNDNKVIYCDDTDWYYLSKGFYHKTDYDDWLELENKLMSRYYKLHCIQVDLIVNKRINDYLEFCNVEVIDLKTRKKIIRYFRYDGLEVKRITTYKKNKNMDCISDKLKITNDCCLIFDNRSSKDKIKFNMFKNGSRKNNKEMTYNRW